VLQAQRTAPRVSAAEERPLLLPSAAAAPARLWDLQRAPPEHEIDALLTKIGLKKRGTRPTTKLTHRYKWHSTAYKCSALL
jgi:hypothetical protein